ncbi:hypothetical protein TNIN_160541 [Trichonephila inaurata madagascariensis]|uniref:Uncharacterized protein n=1 Tax=Trichonephila inaurata madagascariensis TaxID=2747483 RepID=A0A8X6J552_9ARAC|nr:hypothetical protein TNIN_160541 [Trichonephila inaurata madagascariensis]
MVWVMNHKSETNPSKTTPFHQGIAFDSERPLVRDCNEREFCHSMELIPVFIKDRHFHSPNRTYAGYSLVHLDSQLKSGRFGDLGKHKSWNIPNNQMRLRNKRSCSINPK